MITNPLKISLKILNRFKFRLCNRLNHCACNWSRKDVKTAVIAFVIISSSVSVYTASKGVFGKPDLALFKRNQGPERAPHPFYPDYHLKRTILLHEKIEYMIKYLDSLSLHDTYRYHAIIKANPNLLKNIQSIELQFHPLNQK